MRQRRVQNVDAGRGYANIGIMATTALRELIFVASSRDDLKAFPEDAEDQAGFALYKAQLGERHASAKPLKGFGGAPGNRGSR